MKRQTPKGGIDLVCATCKVRIFDRTQFNKKPQCSDCRAIAANERAKAWHKKTHIRKV